MLLIMRSFRNLLSFLHFQSKFIKYINYFMYHNKQKIVQTYETLINTTKISAYIDFMY